MGQLQPQTNIYADIAAWPQGCKYTVDDRIRVLTEYVSTGSLRKTAENTGITHSTIQYWRDNAPWWEDYLVQIRTQKNDEVDALITSLMEKSLQEQSDRMENGNFKVLSNGEIVREKPNLQSLSVNFGILYDKRDKIRNIKSLASGETGDRINSLAEKIKNLENNLKPALDAERVDDK